MNDTSGTDPTSKVQFWLNKAAKGARGFASVVGGLEGEAIDLAAGIVEGISELLTERTPEEVRELIYQLVANPAKKIDLTDAEREVARIIADRRKTEAEADQS